MTVVDRDVERDTLTSVPLCKNTATAIFFFAGIRWYSARSLRTLICSSFRRLNHELRTPTSELLAEQHRPLRVYIERRDIGVEQLPFEFPHLIGCYKGEVDVIG